MTSRPLRLLALAGCLAAGAAAQTYTLITEPSQGLAAIYNLIGSAKTSLDMTMYQLDDTEVEQLLAQAASSGVAVRVILDQNLEKSNNTPAYNYLDSHGVQVHWANPAYAATHQKTIVADGASAAIMTLNLTSEYYSDTRDFAVMESDPDDIAAIEATFDADFTNSAITPPLGDHLAWSPTNSQAVILSVIGGATHSLLVENEEMSAAGVVNALAGAAQRGVLVEVTMTNTSNEYASEFNQLVAAGVEVSTYAATAPLYIHAKVMLADYGSTGARVFIGSENFSNASLTENRELGLTLSDAGVMQSVHATLVSDFNGGTFWPGSKAGFSLSMSSPSLTVSAGHSKTLAATVSAFGGFNSAVALTASGLPAGVTAGFTPSPIAAPGSGSSTLQLSAEPTALAGTYSITITGAGGGVTACAVLDITVVSIEVVNAASFQAGVASGGWLTILGTNFSPVMEDWTNFIVGGQLPTSLDGVNVTAGGQPAYIAFVSPGQINAVAPGVASGTILVTVNALNGDGTSGMAVAQAVQPAFFQWGAYAVATHSDYTYAIKNGALPVSTVPAAPSDVIILWGTGFGPVSPPAPAGAVTPSGIIYNTASAVTVTLGNSPAAVYGAALAPGFAALYQIAIQIPDSLADGDYSVVATVSGAQSPSNVLLTVQR